MPQEEAIAFDNMTMDYLEALVGRKPDAIEVREKWVIATYAQAKGGNVDIHFRKW